MKPLLYRNNAEPIYFSDLTLLLEMAGSVNYVAYIGSVISLLRTIFDTSAEINTIYI